MSTSALSSSTQTRSPLYDTKSFFATHLAHRQSIGDITVTFQGSITIPAKQVYKHPIHNFSIVSYDPALLGTTPVKPAKLSSTSLVQGDSVIMVAISGEGVGI